MGTSEVGEEGGVHASFGPFLASILWTGEINAALF